TLKIIDEEYYESVEGLNDGEHVFVSLLQPIDTMVFENATYNEFNITSLPDYDFYTAVDSLSKSYTKVNLNPSVTLIKPENYDTIPESNIGSPYEFCWSADDPDGDVASTYIYVDSEYGGYEYEILPTEGEEICRNITIASDDYLINWWGQAIDDTGGETLTDLNYAFIGGEHPLNGSTTINVYSKADYGNGTISTLGDTQVDIYECQDVFCGVHSLDSTLYTNAAGSVSFEKNAFTGKAWRFVGTKEGYSKSAYVSDEIEEDCTEKDVTLLLTPENDSLEEYTVKAFKPSGGVLQDASVVVKQKIMSHYYYYDDGTTDANGEYDFSIENTRFYEITVSHETHGSKVVKHYLRNPRPSIESKVIEVQFTGVDKSEPNLNYVYGYVTNTTDNPIQGAKVTVKHDSMFVIEDPTLFNTNSKYTDSNGFYNISIYNGTILSFKAEDQDHITHSTILGFQTSDTEYNVSLENKKEGVNAYSYSATVIDGRDETPIEGIAVCLYYDYQDQRMNNNGLCEYTNGAGKIVFPDLSTCNYSVYFSDNSGKYMATQRDFLDPNRFSCDVFRDEVVKMYTPDTDFNRIRGTVYLTSANNTRTRLSDGYVKLYDESGFFVTLTTTDDLGHFEFNQPEGIYELSAQYSDLSASVGDVKVDHDFGYDEIIIDLNAAEVSGKEQALGFFNWLINFLPDVLKLMVMLLIMTLVAKAGGAVRKSFSPGGY
ncbi:hypothetical protein AKJ59_00695, partial [candidate division MSBL1 archaeon SCGC-AAA385M02]